MYACFKCLCKCLSKYIFVLPTACYTSQTHGLVVINFRFVLYLSDCRWYYPTPEPEKHGLREVADLSKSMTKSALDLWPEPQLSQVPHDQHSMCLGCGKAPGSCWLWKTGELMGANQLSKMHSHKKSIFQWQGVGSVLCVPKRRSVPTPVCGSSWAWDNWCCV